MTGGIWHEVAAAGTDPRRLAQVVARATTVPSPGLADRALADVDAGRAGPDDVLDRLTLGPTDAERRDAVTAARTWARLGVRVALVGDPGYPGRLAAGWPHNTAPPLLARRGPAASGGHPTGSAPTPAVAIVGARRASPYGTGIAAWLAQSASAAGVLVVSGGALGIDAAAHGAAAEGSGGTLVVLGCGHAVGYPRPHACDGGLFERVLAAGGALVSESLPDAPPRPAYVRARNRIVAGLVDAVVVVEGGHRSGSLVTAGVAAELGIPVLAVPGDVRAPGSAAPHRLLRDGAAPCTGPDDLLGVLGTTSIGSDGATTTGRPSVLPAPVLAELARRWPRAVRVDDLAEISGLAVATLLAAVTRAQIAGEVVDGPEGLRLCRAP